MSNEGTNAREHPQFDGPGRNFGSKAQELRMDEGQTTGMSTTTGSLGATNDLGNDEIISNSTHPTAKRLRPMFELQRGTASAAVPHVLPSFANQQGQFARDFQAPQHSTLFHASQNTLHPQLFYQVKNMEMGGKYGAGYYFPVASATAQGNGNNYHLPTSNFTKQLLVESSSSRVQLPPTLDSSYNKNPLIGAANGTPPPYFPRLSSGLGVTTQEMMLFGGLHNFSSGGRSFYESQSSNSQQQRLRANIHPKHEVGESSRSVKMKMTVPENSLQSTGLQMGTFLNPTTPSNGNPQLPRPLRNSIYDPKFEQMGLPVDPHLRMLLRG